MLNKERYITRGVINTIPVSHQLIMWELIRNMPVKQDYLQVFRLYEEGCKQVIVHTQEVPEYKSEYSFACDETVTGKIFVIDDGTHLTMLMANEY